MFSVWDGKTYISHKSYQVVHNLIRVRDTNIHAHLRKQWNRAFGPGPLQDYEESLIARGTELVEHLKDVCHNSTHEFGHADIADYIGRWRSALILSLLFGHGLILLHLCQFRFYG